jgi:cytochrome c oxidase subunit 1/cytochrome c oxidase subunit I+III
VASRHPLWEDRLNDTGGRSNLDTDIILDRGRETLASTALDAEADAILVMPGASLIPIACSLAITVLFFALLWQAWWIAGVGALLITLTSIAWLTPRAPGMEDANV